MVPVTPVFRVLAAVLVGAGAVLGAAPALAAHGAPSASEVSTTSTVSTVAARAETERAVFTGTFVRRPSITVEDAVPVRRYQVSVDEVYGDVPITTKRVTVRAKIPLENCDATVPGVGQGQAGGAQQEQATPGQTSTPVPTDAPTEPSAPTSSADPDSSATIDKQLRVFVATREDAEFVVADCSGVTVADAAEIAKLVERLGEGRKPGAVQEPTAPLDDVGYLCPDTRDSVDLDDSASCEALSAGQSFDRAAAPGLALVIVGILGLLVVRRVGRRKPL